MVIPKIYLVFYVLIEKTKILIQVEAAPIPKITFFVKYKSISVNDKHIRMIEKIIQKKTFNSLDFFLLIVLHVYKSNNLRRLIITIANPVQYSVSDTTANIEIVDNIIKPVPETIQRKIKTSLKYFLNIILRIFFCYRI